MADILGYARVSTGQQDLSGQRERLKEAGAIKIFEDVISGKISDRPGLEELIAYARKDDLLCVVRLDRLGRSLKELLEIVARLKDSQIGLMSLEEKIDTSSAAGELVFHVCGAIAQFERRLIIERTKDGIHAARLRGAHLGRPVLDQDKLEAALKLVESGFSPTQAAKQVQLGRSTVYRELKIKK
jgi:DNA invertase Pin-like site-specific DNA recombinase